MKVAQRFSAGNPASNNDRVREADDCKERRDLLAFFGDRKEYLLLNSPFDETSPQPSPDGHWIAYASDETTKAEIYVQSFSADGKLGADKKRVSSTGGAMPVWRRDGSELFFCRR